jgi:hypothetical protein
MSHLHLLHDPPPHALSAPVLLLLHLSSLAALSPHLALQVSDPVDPGPDVPLEPGFDPLQGQLQALLVIFKQLPLTVFSYSFGKSVEGASLNLGMLEDGRGPAQEELVEEFALSKEGHKVQVRGLKLPGPGTAKPEGKEPMRSSVQESFLSLL